MSNPGQWSRLSGKVANQSWAFPGVAETSAPFDLANFLVFDPNDHAALVAKPPSARLKVYRFPGNTGIVVHVGLEAAP